MCVRKVVTAKKLLGFFYVYSALSGMVCFGSSSVLAPVFRSFQSATAKRPGASTKLVKRVSGRQPGAPAKLVKRAARGQPESAWGRFRGEIDALLEKNLSPGLYKKISGNPYGVEIVIGGVVVALSVVAVTAYKMLASGKNVVVAAESAPNSPHVESVQNIRTVEQAQIPVGAEMGSAIPEWLPLGDPAEVAHASSETEVVRASSETEVASGQAKLPTPEVEHGPVEHSSSSGNVTKTGTAIPEALQPGTPAEVVHASSETEVVSSQVKLPPHEVEYRLVEVSSSSGGAPELDSTSGNDSELDSSNGVSTPDDAPESDSNNPDLATTGHDSTEVAGSQVKLPPHEVEYRLVEVSSSSGGAPELDSTSGNDSELDLMSNLTMRQVQNSDGVFWTRPAIQRTQCLLGPGSSRTFPQLDSALKLNSSSNGVCSSDNAPELDSSNGASTPDNAPGSNLTWGAIGRWLVAHIPGASTVLEVFLNPDLAFAKHDGAEVGNSPVESPKPKVDEQGFFSWLFTPGKKVEPMLVGCKVTSQNEGNWHDNDKGQKEALPATASPTPEPVVAGGGEIVAPGNNGGQQDFSETPSFASLVNPFSECAEKTDYNQRSCYTDKFEEDPEGGEQACRFFRAGLDTSADGLYMTGHCAGLGRGGEVNHQQALEFFNRSHSLGNWAATIKMGSVPENERRKFFNE
ncbi:MAG: hypothetical protein LBF72_00600 [Holosporales bacterium]|jgi:hypothetical protein|nr:hypothetical protein [Holosporales bacterium]